MTAERIQALIHKLEVDGSRWLNYVVLALMVLALGVWYDVHSYRNFSSPEAMDAAQVARNLADGNGYTTEFIRPFSVYLLQKNGRGGAGIQISGTNVVDTGRVYGRHPDLANAPLYPIVLAGLLKLTGPDRNVEMRKPFWSEDGKFVRYKPEFIIAIFNQLLLLAAVLLTFLVAKTILDIHAAWLAAILMLCSDELWKFSVSGLPMLLLLVIFLGVVWCLTAFEELGRAENPDPRRRLTLALLAGLLVGLGMLTRYSFGWLIVPVMAFFALFGGTKRTTLAAGAFVVCGVTVLPWVIRNLVVSGTLFGTAGYAIMQETFVFPGSRLMQLLSPDLIVGHRITPYVTKWWTNVRVLLQDGLPRLGGGWMGILFLAGLLLGLRNVVARRMRYFTLICLGMMLFVVPLGQTQLSVISPDYNTENLLVLLTPLAVIFGVAFFLTLLDQMNLPIPQLRYFVIVMVLLLVRLQFALTLLPPRTAPPAFPPYNPPEIQKIGGWMNPNELVMSDIPWAVAWYGDRQCVWLTANSQSEFYQFNDYVKPVSSLYLSFNTLDSKFWTECLPGGAGSWGNFALRYVVRQIPPGFPLKASPATMLTGLFLTDHPRWQTE